MRSQKSKAKSQKSKVLKVARCALSARPGLWAFAFCLLTCFSASAQPDLTNFVVMGEGLAAGYMNFSLIRVNQEQAFPAVVARQMRVANFPQFLLQAPGLGNIAGFAGLPARVPGTLQDTVRVPGGPKPTDRRNAQPPFALFSFNVSIPGMKLADMLTRRPVPPLIQSGDMQQTLINLTIGFPGMVVGPNKPAWTQAEYVRQMNPTFALVAVGYYDFVDALANANPALLPDAATFRNNFSAVLSAVRGPGIPVIVANVPDPLDTGFVSTLDAAAQLLVAPPDVLRGLYRLRADDLITVPGLMAIGSHLIAERIEPLPPGSVVSADVASQIRARVRAVNSDIASVAQQQGASLFDLFALFQRVRASGLVAGGRVLTADFQGGLYSLDGFYPGATMHAVIANEILGVINRAFNTSYPLADVNAAAASDPVGRQMPARRRHSRQEVSE